MFPKYLVRDPNPPGQEDGGAPSADEAKLLEGKSSDGKLAGPEAEPTPRPGPTSPPAPIPPAQVDYVKQLAEQQAAFLEQMRKQQVAPSEAPPVKPIELFRMRPEEADKLIVGGEETATYINQLVDTLRREMFAINQAYMQEQLSPLLPILHQQQKERAKQDFVKQYPDLTEYVDFAEDVANSLLSQKQYTDRAAFLEDVARVTRSYRDKFKGTPAAPAPAGPTPPGAERSPARPSGSPLSEDEAEMKAVADMMG
jgi:hypothetical protein